MNAVRWIIWFSSLCAAVATAAPEPLTIDAAVAQAANNAPQLQAQLAAADSANAEVAAAGRIDAPELVAGVENLPVNGADAWSVQRDSMTMRKIGVMQSFGSGKRRSAERSLAQAHAQVAGSDAAQARLDVSLSAAQAWIGVLTAEQTVRALESLQPNYALQAKLARNALASGRGGSAEALEAESAEAELSDRLLAARQQVVAARAELGRWIGKPADDELAPPPSFASLPGNASTLQEGVMHHAVIRALDARVEEAKAAVGVAAAEKRPDWSTELSYAQRGPGYSDMVSLEVRVQLTLFGARRTDPTIAARRAAVRQIEAERMAAYDMHVAELATMLADWRAGRERVTLLEQQRLPLARQRTAAAMAALASGASDLKSTLGALRDQLELEREYAQIRGDYGRAWAYLSYLTNGSIAP